ncbi:subtilisin-like protease SBT3.6 isoform X2 [Prunus yedoensis var. nudiflora]|uniref:Subtilisin-like protease SBT3.6 isoform X2 n=1 Tax=Prunus yedoensis var. nudiflora TaxID=2094558 RepID=A0A314Y4J9_PRUYE|nr:subtilisin-like protease SBT3.6 isoform X2 [Prunus yedoensis var. nudiflora]
MASSGIIATLFLVLALHSSWVLLSFASRNVYIVYMGERQHEEPDLVSESHHEILSNVFGSKEAAKQSILYSYKHGFSGFAAVLTQSQAKLIADIPGVVHVIPNRVLNLHTTRSWNFLQVNSHISNGILSRSQLGAGSIIGIMDTGIWPESVSFRDDGMGDVPSRWRGICQEGEKFNRSHCNRKIIGARWYIKGYEAEFGNLNTSDGFEFRSPRDAGGHGTHTASTAAGASIENASFMGLAAGLARGGAPSARLAVYKVCWATGGCSSADLLAAFDDAIFDGVDVLSASLGSPPPLPSYVEDVVSIGSFHAVAKGISVICSAGNSGSYPQTVINSAPWIFTVAASTIDRAFPTVITLGNNQTVVGQALYTGMDTNKFYPLVYGGDIASIDADEDSAGNCDSGTLNDTLASGKRLAITAIRTVMKVRGAGLIFAQFPSKDVSLTSGSLPCVQVDFAIGTYLLTYMGATRNPVVKFNPTKTQVGQQISPEVAFFSSRGPNSLSPSILKPDITAPGVNILASWSPARSLSQSPDTFQIESGTSMSCPHISGIVALLKAIYPTWSPAAIKSALVTTASLEDEYAQSIVAEGAPHKQADPFDYGGGHVDPNKAISPGLIYDIESSDYIHFLCSMGYNNTAISLVAGTKITCQKSTKFIVNLNLPSITIHELKQSMTVSRRVTNVGPVNSVYFARVQAPAGVSVKVKPSVLSFNSTVKKLQFKVIFCSLLRVQGRFSFGNLFWEDGLHVVRIPLVVRTVLDDLYAVT